MDMDKRALITGGSSGLGLAFAEMLGRRGYSVIIMGRNSERLQNAREKLQAENISVAALRCDVTSDQDVQSAAQSIDGTIDLLLLNAGVVTCTLLRDVENMDSLRQDLDINLWGSILCARRFMPLLKKGARVALISSGFGLMGPAGYSVYAASKAGMINFAESLRRELLNDGIRVHVACPGDIDTPQYQREQESMPAWLKSGDPRKVMSPETAARKILAGIDRGQFLILINADIKLLVWMGKLLPGWLKDFFIDRIFPLPPASK